MSGCRGWWVLMVGGLVGCNAQDLVVGSFGEGGAPAPSDAAAPPPLDGGFSGTTCLVPSAAHLDQPDPTDMGCAAQLTQRSSSGAFPQVCPSGFYYLTCGDLSGMDPLPAALGCAAPANGPPHNLFYCCPCAELPDGAGAPPEGGGASATIELSTCASTGDDPDASATLGAGYVGLPPAECSAALGTVVSSAGVSGFTSVLSGAWYACNGSVVGIPVPGAIGLQFSSDGHYVVLAEDDNDTLVPASDLSDAGPSDGTYVLSDGSASYGPGTFELELHPSTGSLLLGQVVVYDSPRQFQFSATNGATTLFSSAPPWSSRAGHCACVQKSASKVAPTDATELAAALTGRWIWCAGPQPPGTGVPMGVEFTSDGSWYELQESADGTVARATDARDHGTFQLLPTTSLPGIQLGPEPLTLEMDSMAGGGQITQVVVTSNPDTLSLAVSTTDDADAGVTNVYSILFPAP